MKKKIATTILAVSLAMSSVFLNGCGNTDNGDKKDVKTENTKENTGSRYVFRSGDKTISIGEDGEKVLDKLGEANDTFTATSCAFEGEDHMYMYNSFQITLSSIEGKERLAAITITDDGVATPEGIRIGSTDKEVLKALSTEHKDDGQYSMTDGNTKLSVTVKNDEVIAINYTYVKP